MKKKFITLLFTGIFSGCVAMQNNINSLKVRIANLESIVQAQYQVINELQKELKQLKKSKFANNSTLPSDIISLKTQLIAEMEDLKNQQNTLASELEDLKFNQEQINNELRKEVADLNTKIEVLKIEVESLKKLVNQKKQQLTAQVSENKTQGNYTYKSSTQSLKEQTNATSNKTVSESLKVATSKKVQNNATSNFTANQTNNTATSNTVTSNQSSNQTQANIQSPEENLKNLSEAELYEKAYDYYRNHEYKKALQTFKFYLRKFPQGKWIGQAYFWIGECYFHLKQYEEAILSYEKLIELPQFHPLKPAALFRQAMAFKALGDEQAYQIILKKLIQTYPYSKEAIKAKKLLNEK